MKVRKMAGSDKPRWLELRRALWPDCPAARHRLEMDQWQRSHGVVLLAESAGGRAVGFAEISIRWEHVEDTLSAPVPYLEAWYVVPGHRRKGVGKALIERAKDWAMGAGISELASDAENDNRQAMRALRGLGFREVGRSVHFVRPLRARKVGCGVAPNGDPSKPMRRTKVTEGLGI